MPVLGRNFNEEEQTPGQDRVIILTHRVWRGRFGANPGILGTTISLDSNPHTVVGVLPAGFEFPRGTDLYIPYAPAANVVRLTGQPLPGRGGPGEARSVDRGRPAGHESRLG